jgi:hypothetical protein
MRLDLAWNCTNINPNSAGNWIRRNASSAFSTASRVGTYEEEV